MAHSFYGVVNRRLVPAETTKIVSARCDSSPHQFACDESIDRLSLPLIEGAENGLDQARSTSVFDRNGAEKRLQQQEGGPTCGYSISGTISKPATTRRTIARYGAFGSRTARKPPTSVRCLAACMPMCGMMGTESIIRQSSSRPGAPYGSSDSAKDGSCLCCPFRSGSS